MNENKIHISLKMKKMIELFDSKKVTFSEVMKVGRYTNPLSAWEAVGFLLKHNLISVAFIHSTFIKI